MFDRYNFISEDDLRRASQKTTMYMDTLPRKQASDSRLASSEFGRPKEILCLLQAWLEKPKPSPLISIDEPA